MTMLQFYGLLLLAGVCLFAKALVKWHGAGPRDDRFIQVGWLVVYGGGSALATFIILSALTHPAFASLDAAFPIAWLFWLVAGFDALVVVDLAVKAIKWLAHPANQP